MAEPDAIRALLDRQEIRDQIYRYCRAVDRLDAELGYSVFHPDAYADYGAELYQGDGRGVIDDVLDRHGEATAHSHQLANILIEVDGDRAASESYVFATVLMPVDGRDSTIRCWARYVDRWSRRDGIWAIDSRVVIRDFDEVTDATPLTPGLDRGKRDRTDPSYHALGSPAASAASAASAAPVPNRPAAGARGTGEERDVRAITELKARYCRLMDTKQWGAWGELFTDDYRLDVSGETGLPVIVGRDAVLAHVRSKIENAVTVHQVHNPEIRIDGDTAHATWAMNDRVIFRPDGPSITGYGFYHERLERIDGAWRIAELALSRLHIDVH